MPSYDDCVPLSREDSVLTRQADEIARLTAEVERLRGEVNLFVKSSAAHADERDTARANAQRLAEALNGECPKGCSGIRLPLRDWSGCRCNGRGCDCPQHKMPTEDVIRAALAAHEGGEAGK